MDFFMSKIKNLAEKEGILISDNLAQQFANCARNSKYTVMNGMNSYSTIGHRGSNTAFNNCFLMEDCSFFRVDDPTIIDYWV